MNGSFWRIFQFSSTMGQFDMKKLILLVTLLTSMSLNAQSDYTANWSVEGITSVVSLRYDLDIGSVFIGAHGGVNFDNGLTQPSTGTCYTTAGGGLFCNLSLNSFNMTLDIGASLDGVIRTIGASGEILEAGAIRFTGLE